ncbi:MAG: Fe-S cluster assembly protein SufD [Ignavibacteriales bacterium]|nr:Fe-S cluster assembly protein SufD [Ignavibacteriales bacterium]
MNNIEHKSANEWYVSKFKSFEDKLNGQSKSFLHDIRKNALISLAELSFPTNRNEEWKYTNVTPILKQNFIPALISTLHKFRKEEIKPLLFKDFDYHLIVFVNGLFAEELSEIGNLPKGVVVDGLNRITKNNPDSISKYINKLSKIDNAFNALNTAYSYDGLVVILPDGMILEKPIQVLYLNSSKDDLVLSTPRNLIVAGKNSQVSVITNYNGYSNKTYFSNIITEVYVEENAIVDFYKIQNENDESYHIEKVQAIQKKNSVFNHYNINFGGAIVRNDINTLHDDQNIETHYYGLYLAHGKQHVDNHTFVDHAKPNCMSNELYKGILDDNSRGVFNGKIIVRRDAQKTNAYQQNKTILLSKTATIDTKPQLEIFADDVKCSHGATVGHLDDTSEFYIRSRGVPQELAKSMLIRAFANDVIDTVKIEPLKEQINHMIFEHLHRVEVGNEQ